MPQFDKEQLFRWKKELQEEIAELESQCRPLIERIDEMREKLDAMNCLIGVNGSTDTKGSAGTPIGERVAVIQTTRREPNSAREGFTPVDAYWVPILASLVELGGSAPSERVIERVGKKMEAILTPADQEPLPSGIDVRWRNRVAWQRFNMVRRGLLRGDSPRGIWEITSDGRRWLATGKGNKRNTSTNGVMERLTGETLNERYKLEAKQARYREDGKWYHPLEDFPAVLFDANGYIRFETKAEYDRCAAVKKGPDPNHIHVEDGISSIRGYQQLKPPPSFVVS